MPLGRGRRQDMGRTTIDGRCSEHACSARRRNLSAVSEKTSQVSVLIIDDFGLGSLTPDDAKDFLEIVEDRYMAGSRLFLVNFRSANGIPLC